MATITVHVSGDGFSQHLSVSSAHCVNCSQLRCSGG